jgi:hypothetical protein
MLELVLGSPAVFAPSSPTRAALDKQLRLRGRGVEERQLLYLLRGLMELCLYPPRVSLTDTCRMPTPHNNASCIWWLLMAAVLEGKDLPGSLDGGCLFPRIMI